MKSKKIISILSVSIIFIFLCVLSLTVYAIFDRVNSKKSIEPFAADITGSGTASDPYLIYTTVGYKDLMYNKSVEGNKVYAKLMADISVGILSKEQLPNWIPSSLPSGNKTIDEMFRGGLEFDGNYKEIKFICQIALDENGRIYSIAPIPSVYGPSIIKNLKTTGYITVTGSSSYPPNLSGLVGVAAGTNTAGFFEPDITIENCYVDVDISAQTDSSVSSSAGLIGYTCTYSGGLSGNITVKDTVYCGDISGKFNTVDKITGSTGYPNCNISISSTNTYITGSIPNQSSDTQDSYGYNTAVSGSDNLFVKGDWISEYSNYGYSACPTINWLKNRNSITNPYTLNYELVTNEGIKLGSGTLGKVVSSNDCWNYYNAKISSVNFGEDDNTVDVSSYISDYVYQRGSTSNSGSTITLTLVFSKMQFTITFGDIYIDDETTVSPSDDSIIVTVDDEIQTSCTYSLDGTTILLKIGDKTISWIVDSKYTIEKYGNYSVWVNNDSYENSSLDDQNWTAIPNFKELYGIDYFSFTPSVKLKTYDSEFN